MILQGRRVSLRHIERRDLEALWRWRNSLSFRKLCSVRRDEIGLEDFERELVADFERDRHEQFMIRENCGRTAIGTIYSYNLNLDDGFVFMTVFLEEAWVRKGYGADAFVLFLHHLFESHPLHKIYTEVYGYNETSLSAMLGGGFVEEGRFKEHRVFDGRRWDLIRLAFYRRQLESIRRLTAHVRGARQCLVPNSNILHS